MRGDRSSHCGYAEGSFLSAGAVGYRHVGPTATRHRAPLVTFRRHCGSRHGPGRHWPAIGSCSCFRRHHAERSCWVRRVKHAGRQHGHRFVRPAALHVDAGHRHPACMRLLRPRRRSPIGSRAEAGSLRGSDNAAQRAGAIRHAKGLDGCSTAATIGRKSTTERSIHDHL